MNADPRNLPIKGFIAASSKVLKAYNSFCDGGDLYTINNYKQVFWITNQNSMFGAFDRIELDPRSCAKDNTSNNNASVRRESTGRN